MALKRKSCRPIAPVRAWVSRELWAFVLLSLVLLSSFELAIVDRNSIIYIRVERLFVLIDLNEFILNVILKSVVEPSLKRVGSLIDSEYELSELRGILDS